MVNQKARQKLSKAATKFKSSKGKIKLSNEEYRKLINEIENFESNKNTVNLNRNNQNNQNNQNNNNIEKISEAFEKKKKKKIDKSDKFLNLKEIILMLNIVPNIKIPIER